MKHKITLEHPKSEVIATIHSTVLASTTSPILMKEVGGLGYDPVFYFPIEDVKREFFTHSNTRSNCYLKGEAIYWSLELDTLKLPDVAWEYVHPAPGMEKISRHIAFYSNHVKVEAIHT